MEDQMKDLGQRWAAADRAIASHTASGVSQAKLALLWGPATAVIPLASLVLALDGWRAHAARVEEYCGTVDRMRRDLASFLSLGERARRIWLGLFAAACVLEVALITLQAWRRVPSHFDLETPFDAIIARALAIGGGGLIAVVVAFAVVAFRANPGTAPSMRLAIRAGFIALLLALAVGATMIAEGMLRVFAGDQQGASIIAASLKPAHAVAMHGILVLPALAWLLSLADWDESQRVRLVWLATAGYALLVGVVTAVSFSRIALTDAPVVAVFLAILGAVVLCGAGIVAVVGLMRPTADRGRVSR